MIELQPNDRLLIIGRSDPSAIRSAAGTLTSGLVVVVADEDFVREGRADLRDLDNVMFVSEAGEPTLPWRDEFFSVVAAPNLDDPTPEILRVAAKGAAIYLRAFRRSNK